MHQTPWTIKIRSELTFDGQFHMRFEQDFQLKIPYHMHYMAHASLANSIKINVFRKTLW